jgi:WD40 repeat protein
MTVSRRRRSILCSPLILLLMLPLEVSRATAATPPPCAASSSPSVVYALRGAVYRVSTDGRNRCRLTTAVSAKEPQLSPDGRWVAFLSGVGSDGYGAGATNEVRVTRPGNPSASPGKVINTERGAHRFLAWSPDGRKLAYIGDSGVWVWRFACRCSQLLRLLVPEARPRDFQSLVWSPDSRHLAALLFTPPTPATQELPVIIADAQTGRRHVVSVHFPVWVKGKSPFDASYPSHLISWLPTGTLLIGTSGVGVGLRLTGIWTAPATGGMARLTVGLATSPRVTLKFPLLYATTALPSPDRSKVLLNPDSRLWIASSSGRNGKVLDLHVNKLCRLGQLEWAGNRRLAYVSLCPTAPSSEVLAQLYTLALGGGRPFLLATVRSIRQDDLSIAPPSRCIACA